MAEEIKSDPMTTADRRALTPEQLASLVTLAPDWGELPQQEHWDDFGHYEGEAVVHSLDDEIILDGHFTTAELLAILVEAAHNRLPNSPQWSQTLPRRWGWW